MQDIGIVSKLIKKKSIVTKLQEGINNLYAIQGELEKLNDTSGLEIVAVLGSVRDEAMLTRVLTEEAVQIVLHAAAYKHVPLVEGNEVAGLGNNVLGT